MTNTKNEYEMALEQKIQEHRRDITKILDGKDDRMLVIVGPCSVHDYKQALEYAHLLKELEMKFRDTIKIVMRTYFQKPRTVLGWEGFAVDPDLDGSYNVEKGIVLVQKLLDEITELGLPCADEALTIPLTKKWASKLSYAAVGARNSEDPNTRKYASGLACPVGVKHPRSGSLQDGMNGVLSVSSVHQYFDESVDGMVKTTGNPYAHLILRGSSDGPNITSEVLRLVSELALEKGARSGVVVDVSHDNCRTVSGKDYALQISNVEKALELASEGVAVRGLMIESNLRAGNQKLGSELEYGVSITDPCIDIEQTAQVLEKVSRYVLKRRKEEVSCLQA